MLPTWLTVVAWVSLAASLLASAIITWDIFGTGYRQRMGVMDAVWPITALYLGPAAWLGYRHWGRLNSPRFQAKAQAKPDYRQPISVAIAVGHCGAGCTLGDIIGEWLVFVAGWQLAGLALPAEYLADFVLAFGLGVAFQYFAIVPMRDLRVREGLVVALKADALSLTSFEIGLFGWMALMQSVFFPRPRWTPIMPPTGFSCRSAWSWASPPPIR